MNEHDRAAPMTSEMLIIASRNTRKWRDFFRKTLADVPVIESDGRPFAIRLADVPEPHRTAFAVALRDRSCPTIEGQGKCAYLLDWQDWIEGRLPE